MTAGADGQPLVNKARISETTWIYDQQSKFIENLSKYIGFITNTNTSFSEPLQVNFKQSFKNY